MGDIYIATCSSCKFESDQLLHGQGALFDGGATKVLLDMQKQTLISKRVYGELSELDKRLISVNLRKKPTRLNPERYKIYGEDPSLGPFGKKGLPKKTPKYTTKLDQPTHFYLCPKCLQKTLKFINCGLWD